MIKTNTLQNGRKYYEYATGNRKRLVGVVSISPVYIQQMIGWVIDIW